MDISVRVTASLEYDMIDVNNYFSVRFATLVSNQCNEYMLHAGIKRIFREYQEHNQNHINIDQPKLLSYTTHNQNSITTLIVLQYNAILQRNCISPIHRVYFPIQVGGCCRQL